MTTPSPKELAWLSAHTGLSLAESADAYQYLEEVGLIRRYPGGGIELAKGGHPFVVATDQEIEATTPATCFVCEGSIEVGETVILRKNGDLMHPDPCPNPILMKAVRIDEDGEIEVLPPGPAQVPDSLHRAAAMTDDRGTWVVSPHHFE